MTLTLAVIDAFLGADLVKLRIARKGAGKSVGYRTVVAYRSKARAFFLYVFAKSEKENMSQEDRADCKRAGDRLLAATDQQLNDSVRIGEIQEIK